METDGDRHLLGPPIEAELKGEFRDLYERRAYFRSYLLGRRLLENPDLLERGRAFLERFVKPDPRQQRIYDLWSDALTLPVGELVGQLLAHDARGAELRETAPVFVVIPAEEVRDLVKSAA